MLAMGPGMLEITGLAIAFAIFAGIIGVLLYRSRYRQRRESG